MPATVSRAILRHSAVGLTKRKHAMLRELARRSTNARFEFVREYWDVRYVSVLLRYPRALIETQRRRGDLKRHGLTTHQSEVAFKDALWMLRVSWARTLDASRWRIYRNPVLNDRSKRWMFFVLRWPDLLQACVFGGEVHIERAWADGLDERRLAQRLRRIILSSRGRCPRTGKRLWFTADTSSTGRSSDLRIAISEGHGLL
jgi:hypothetical protein